MNKFINLMLNLKKSYIVYSKKNHTNKSDSFFKKFNTSKRDSYLGKINK